MKWIKASERLPQDNREYFVIANGIKTVGIFSEGSFWNCDEKLRVSKWLDESDEWISVDDRLPEYGERVLVMGEHKAANPSMGGAYCAIDYRSDIKGTSFENDKRLIEHNAATKGFLRMAYVTHWQPLPQPPKQ